MKPDLIGFEKFFLGVAPLSVACMEALRQHWTVEVHLRRKEFLYQPGNIGQHLYYVISGELWIYYLVEEKEICVGLSYPDTLTSSAASFISGKPSRYYIQALTPTQLIGIRKSDLLAVLERFPELERAWRRMTEMAFLGRLDREYEMLSLTPEERYQSLWERSSKVFQLFPQKILASYLGMSPEHFSRVKRKIQDQSTS